MDEKLFKLDLGIKCLMDLAVYYFRILKYKDKNEKEKENKNCMVKKLKAF